MKKWLAKILCIHHWEILSEKVMESQIECLYRLGFAVKRGGSDMATRDLIQILTCRKCGGLKKYVTTT